MRQIKPLLDELFEKHHVPVKYEANKKGEHTYSCGYNFSKVAKDPLIFTVWAQDFQEDQGMTNYQITFRLIAKLEDPTKRAEALEVINRFNQTLSGPFTVMLDDYNQMSMRLLDVTSAEAQDINLIYTLVQFGLKIAGQLYIEFQNELNGKDLKAEN